MSFCGLFVGNNTHRSMIAQIFGFAFAVYLIVYFPFHFHQHMTNNSGSNNKSKQSTKIDFRVLLPNSSMKNKTITLKQFSQDYEEFSMNSSSTHRLLYSYSLGEIYFTLTTTTQRIRSTIDEISFWASKPNVRCLIIFESDDLVSRYSTRNLLNGKGIRCAIETSNITRFEERYLKMIHQAWYSLDVNSSASRETIQWFAFGDDDTVWFLGNLLQQLQRYSSSDRIYLGNISNRLTALKRHGTYFAYGGGGIVLSRSLASQVAQLMPQCQQFVHVWGGDEMIGKCITQVCNVSLTINEHFHQMDIDGDMEGYLESGLEGLISLHHMFSYWEPFPEQHTVQPKETIQLLRLAYEAFGPMFLKRYVRIDSQHNQTFLLTLGYSFSLFNRALAREELMEVEQSWCCDELARRTTRPKEVHKLTWYFRDVTNVTRDGVHARRMVYENSAYAKSVHFSRLEIILTL